MRHIATITDADALIDEILRGLVRPIVAISNTFGGAYAFDPDIAASRVGRFADVVTLETGDVTRRLEADPLHTRVFDGAARVFYSATEVGRLRFAGSDTIDDLLSDVPMSVSLPTRPKDPEIVTGRIMRSDANTGVLAQLSDGEYARVEVEGVDNPHEYFAVGSTVPGVLADHRLRVARAEFAPASLPSGCVTLGLVVAATPKRASIRIHPGVDDVVLRKRDVFVDETDDDDRVDEIVAVGDVVHVGVFWEETGLRLSLVDVDGTLTPPPALVAGGVPWLSEPEDDDEVDEEEEVVEPITTPVVVQAPDHDVVLDELRRLRVEFRELQRGITVLHSAMARVGSASAPPRRAPDPERVTKLERELHAVERSLQELRTAKAAAERARVEADRARVDAEKKVRALEARVGGQPRDERRDAWGTFEDWIRHEVRLAWVARVPAGEKAALPLGPFGVGPSFEQDLAALTDDQFDKTMRAIVDVLTGRAASLDSREVHRLRTSDAGGSPYLVRASDGADAYRCAIERNTPSARRLHYWRLGDGGIELARVREHDAVGM
ncbi:hypothetical protein GCM10010922_26120 [Microbacterium sorbitolivorans]|uniref:S1 motif domain-containing protein n=1 Tax=Microbacterium sorbitolivorans TaxID=1867410 RepID=A0A367XTU9_9MICO|nr:hypothetical protein [Microbacterium sorbitolivorans]RCK56819.1 hypothetical protein DTO57_13085 [Microbacterium sorbitolivorans]GGF49010.1 hypothetical protein GCM10010922_26120 [Microbacterium sorbitolivorans]